MAFVVLLDANVLVNAAVRDTLLRAAERDMYRLALTHQVLEEVQQALESNLARTREQTAYLIGAISHSFEGSFIEGYEPLIPSMQNDEGDRHVLAAAIRAHAEIIVTFNTRHFPAIACEPYGIEVQHPGAFLRYLWDLDPETMMQILTEQAHDLQGWALTDLIDRLARDAPDFADAVNASGLIL